MKIAHPQRGVHIHRPVEVEPLRNRHSECPRNRASARPSRWSRDGARRSRSVFVPSLTREEGLLAVLEHDPHDIGDRHVQDVRGLGMGLEPHEQRHHHQPEGDDGDHGGAVKHLGTIFDFRIRSGIAGGDFYGSLKCGQYRMTWRPLPAMALI